MPSRIPDSREERGAGSAAREVQAQRDRRACTESSGRNAQSQFCAPPTLGPAHEQPPGCGKMSGGAPQLPQDPTLQRGWAWAAAARYLHISASPPRLLARHTRPPSPWPSVVGLGDKSSSLLLEGRWRPTTAGRVLCPPAGLRGVNEIAVSLALALLYLVAPSVTVTLSQQEAEWGSACRSGVPSPAVAPHFPSALAPPGQNVAWDIHAEAL